MTELTPRKREYDGRVRSGDSIVGLCFGDNCVLEEEQPPYTRPDGRLVRRYVCQCLCGKTRLVTAGNIKHKTPRSCIGCRRKAQGSTQFFLVPGTSFGKLCVLSEQSSGVTRKWLCICECGHDVSITYDDLQSVTKIWCSACAKRVNEERLAARAIRYLHNNYTQHARHRGYRFLLTEAEFVELVTAPCSYCGITSGNTYIEPNTKEAYNYNGVDRIDPAGDYEISNVTTACRDCNFAKQQLTRDQFLALVRRVSVHLNLSVVESYNE